MFVPRITASNFTVIFLLLFMSHASSAQTFTSLVSFNGTNGIEPTARLVKGTDAQLYGVTGSGGTNNCHNMGCGTAFSITTTGTLTTVHDFNGSDGAVPFGGLTLGINGIFYGTTSSGGDNGDGTFFSMDGSHVVTTLHSFNQADGAIVSSPVVQGSDGNFYGTTNSGGTGTACSGGCGTIFKVTPSGKLTTLHNFTGSDGTLPMTFGGGLIQGTDGDFYGTAQGGGAFGYGTCFKITSKGQFTLLHSFDFTDGFQPLAGLIQGSDGNFYGTTHNGGTQTGCLQNCGTIFKMTPKGVLTTLFNFDGTYGAAPYTGVIQATDGNFYGTAEAGAESAGVVYQITPSGVISIEHTFDIVDGYGPIASLLQNTDGVFYGSTSGGGTFLDGTVFSLSIGLDPFVAFIRPSGKVDTLVGILGQGFTGTSKVSFSGHAARFSVKSDTFLSATLPDGATTGVVIVATPSGPLKSNVPFRVLPQLLSFDPPSGPPGTQVTITGVSLTQTLGVGFGDRVQSQFTVNSDTSVTATVPQGAKTGKIGIETNGGVAISQGTFEVTQ